MQKIKVAIGWERRELGLQRSNTNPSLQPAQTKSQLPTVTAGSGPTGSGANVIPQKIAMEDDDQNRMQRQQALHANEAASRTKNSQSPTVLRVAPKRKKCLKDTPPEGMRCSKPKPTHLPADTELSGGLLRGQTL